MNVYLMKDNDGSEDEPTLAFSCPKNREEYVQKLVDGGLIETKYDTGEPEDVEVDERVTWKCIPVYRVTIDVGGSKGGMIKRQPIFNEMANPAEDFDEVRSGPVQTSGDGPDRMVRVFFESRISYEHAEQAAKSGYSNWIPTREET